MASVVQIVLTVLVLFSPVICKSPFDVHFDRMKEEEYDTVIQAVLDLGFQTRHFDSLTCENWCRSAIPRYFSPKVDVTPKCPYGCQEFMVRQERADGEDL